MSDRPAPRQRPIVTTDDPTRQQPTVRCETTYRQPRTPAEPHGRIHVCALELFHEDADHQCPCGYRWGTDG